MACGLLFIGYLLSFNKVAYPGFTKIFAYLVMLLAMTKLARFNRDLKAAYTALIPTAIVGGLYFLLEVASMFSLLPAPEKQLLFRLVPLAIAILELIYLFYLLRGLQAIAKETQVPMLEVKSFRNRLFVVFYYLLFIAAQFDYGNSMPHFLRYFNIALFFVSLVIMFLNAKLIYGFYMWICLPGDEEIKRKTSSIRFLDKLYEKLDALEDKYLKRRREVDEEYREQRQKKKKKGKKK